jgi:PKD repeat protein
MADVPKDYPDGFGRLLPGHTAEMEPGFAEPFYYGGSLVLGAGASGTYTLTFADYAHIYFVDMITITPQSYKDHGAIISINDSPYVAAAGAGWLNIPLRQNPSIQFLAGDHLDVAVTNNDSAQRTFLVKVNGTKILRPDNYDKAPGALYTVDDDTISVGGHIHFTDASSYTPTSWEWDFGDGSAKSTDQNPTHTYSVAGTYYPRLKAINSYGYDNYAIKVVVA